MCTLVAVRMRAIIAAQARGHRIARPADISPAGDEIDVLRNRIVALHRRQRFADADARAGTRNPGICTELPRAESRLANLEERFDILEQYMDQVVKDLEENEALTRSLVAGTTSSKQQVSVEEASQKKGVSVARLDERLAALEGDGKIAAKKLEEFNIAMDTMQDIQSQVVGLTQRVSDVEMMAEGSHNRFDGFAINLLMGDYDGMGQTTQDLQKQHDALRTTVSCIDKTVASLPLDPQLERAVAEQELQFAGSKRRDRATKKLRSANAQNDDQQPQHPELHVEASGDMRQDLAEVSCESVSSPAGTKKIDKAKTKGGRSPKQVSAASCEVKLVEEVPAPRALNDEEESNDARYRFLPSPMPSPSSGFSVITLNILAGYLGRPRTHGYCKPESNLVWDNRKKKLLDGFQRCRADILLLQEVQGTGRPSKDHHVDDLCLTLKEFGYNLGSYARICGEDGQEEGNAESKNWRKPHLGNAVFYQAGKWEQLDAGHVAFAQLLSNQCHGNDLQRERYAEGKQVAAWSRLQHKATRQVLVAVSVHVCNNFQNPDTQVAQTNALLQHLRGQIFQKGDALLIGGDFNSMPSSGVYQLLSTGALEARHPDASVAGVLPLCSPQGFHTGLELVSAYLAVNGSEPEFTTKAPDFSGTIDYLWYLKGTLSPEQGTALKMPTAEEAGAEGGGVPNSEIPSDHVPLGVAFVFPEAATHQVAS